MVPPDMARKIQTAADSGPRQGILTRTTRADRGIVRLPALTPHLRFDQIDGEQALLSSESFNTLLHGRLYCNLLPLLDGGNPQDAIVTALAGNHDAVEIRGALSALSAKGYIVSAEHSMDPERAAWWSALGASPRRVERRLGTMRVSVAGDDGRMRRHLEKAEIRVSAADPDLAVVVCGDYLEERLSAVNRRQLKAQAPWMPVQPRGVETLFGPVFRADREGPCWACLASRLGGHREVHGFLRNVVGEDAAFRAFATEPAAFEAVCGLIALEIAKWLVLDTAAPVHTRAVTLNGATLATAHHPVMRRPQCRACGDDAFYRPDRPAAPVVLRSSPKAHFGSGGARSVEPEATLARYRHLVSPISGVVTWLRRTTDESDPWLHVNWAGSNPGVRSRSLSSLRRSLRSKSAGKGNTRQQAEVSALCEAIERHSGVRHGDEISIRRRFADFAGSGDAIHPNEVQLFSDHQLDNAQHINANGHPYNIIPKRLDPDSEIDWTPLWSLTQERHRYLPTTMLYGMSAEQRGAADLFADSNGCAAGNTREEAILQGFYELVERDAFAIWWYNGLRAPAVDLGSFGDSFLASAGDYYQRCERELWVLDVTADISIPTFVALSRRTAGPTEDIIYGAGAHVDPGTAALRAVCELNQCLTWLPRPGGGSGRPMIDDPLALWWWRTARLAACPWLAADPDAPPRTVSHYPQTESADSRDDVERCRALVEAKGMEFLVLDQTRPDIGMPVVRVVVPGMRHFWARFAPGRLYDVPVHLGRRCQPLDEAALNTAPVIA
jgi:ribosomal protein S12 methylthiotransferase accessory factor